MGSKSHVKLYKANLIAAATYSLASLFVCSTYELFHPHAVGHLFPAISAFAAGAWGLLCWQLGIANDLQHVVALRKSSFPLAVSLVAMAVCWYRYSAQLAA
ncbi:hypothetical protein ACFPN1_16125 [Lysobacter yangpyeongensis]|uniref:Uncharacterized protein n=1 Tax=Lysobacter yangpyeongensis TaxID=346182 RepID=A0ABW0SR37_9GAMM